MAGGRLKIQLHGDDTAAYSDIEESRLGHSGTGLRDTLLLINDWVDSWEWASCWARSLEHGALNRRITHARDNSAVFNGNRAKPVGDSVQISIRECNWIDEKLRLLAARRTSTRCYCSTCQRLYGSSGPSDVAELLKAETG